MSPEVIMDGAIRQKTKFPIFYYNGTICPSHVVLELRRENQIAGKKLVAVATSLEESKIRVQIVHLQP